MTEWRSQIMMAIDDTRRVAVLEEAAGAYTTFNKVKTNTPASVEELRTDWEDWVKNDEFDEAREKPIDLAIVYARRAEEENNPDVDNLAKKVIAALQNHEDDDKNRYLIEDDSQIMRLLVQKMPPMSDKGRITVSFREADYDKPMKLVQPEKI